MRKPVWVRGRSSGARSSSARGGRAFPRRRRLSSPPRKALSVWRRRSSRSPLTITSSYNGRCCCIVPLGKLDGGAASPSIQRRSVGYFKAQEFDQFGTRAAEAALDRSALDLPIAGRFLLRKA